MKKKLVVGLLVLIALSGLAVASTVQWEASSDVEFEAVDGPQITLSEDVELTSAEPHPDSTTIDLGTMTIASDGKTNASLESIPGSETTLTGIDTNGHVLWADHTDAQRIGVDGLTAITWDVIDLDQDVVEIQTTGTGTVFVDGFLAGQGVRVDRGDETEILEADDNGIIEIAVSDDDLTFLEPAEPNLFDAYPVNEEPIEESPVTLQTQLEHDDFPDETVTVNWTLNGEEINTTSHSENGLVSIETDQYVGGYNNWSAIATDSINDSTQINGSFRTPASLEIRDEQTPEQLVNDTETELEVTFFGDSGTIATRTTTTGVVNMTDLPLDESFTVQVDADGYIQRQSYARSVVERGEIYLLNDSAQTVETQFQIEDPTGQFDPETTRVFVKKPIDRDGTTEYEVVVADLLGSGGWTTTLEEGQRYIIEVEDAETGERRNVGPYVASVSELVTLEIDQLDFDFTSETDGSVNYDWHSEYRNETAPAVAFQFEAEETIEELRVRIYKQHNESVVILDEEYRNHDGPIDLRATVPEHIENPDITNWHVEWNATIDGETEGGAMLVGDGQIEATMPGVPDGVLSVVGVLAIFVVAGMFSAANISVGAIVTAIVAGALWFIGVLPEAVSGIFIAVALMIGVMYHMRRGPQPR